MAPTPDTLFKSWAPRFALEAKNRKKKIDLGKVQKFGAKLQAFPCTVGVYLSMTPYTRDACQDVRGRFPQLQIFLIHAGHIQEIIDGANLIQILVDLHFELQFEPKGPSISA